MMSKPPKDDWKDVSASAADVGRFDSQVDWQKFIGNKYRGKTILDVGAGMGHSRSRLAVGGNAVTLQDVADVPNVDIHHPVEHLGQNEFDIVTAFDVVEHVLHDVSFLGSLIWIAREAVFITTPNYNVSKNANPFHVREYAPDELLDLVLLSGPATRRLSYKWFVGNGWGLGLRQISLRDFLYHTEPAHAVLIELNGRTI